MTGSTSKITVADGIATKVVRSDVLWRFPYLVAHEAKALSRLDNCRHFPKLISVKDRTITMADVGIEVTEQNLPKNWVPQIKDIHRSMKAARVQHNDVKLRNLLVKDGELSIIDFGFASFDGKGLLGTPPDWYIPDMEEGIALVDACTKGVKARKVSEYLRSLPKWTAYHKLPFRDLDYNSQRDDLPLRLDMLASSGYKFDGKTGLDVGCSLGALTFALQLKGANMVGMELDSQAYEACLMVEDLYSTGAKFVKGRVPKDLPDRKFDFCLWLACAMWVVDQGGLDALAETGRRLSNTCPTCFFETSVGDGGAGKAMAKAGLDSIDNVAQFVVDNSWWTRWKKLGTASWRGRPVLEFSV